MRSFVKSCKNICVKSAKYSTRSEIIPRLYMKLLPVQIILVIISGINAISEKYVEAIISLAHVMDFEVVAEGVEENEQLEILQSIDCDYIQGFIRGRPPDSKDVENMI